MAPILDFIVNFLLVNSKIYKIMSHKIFQTQKGVNFTLPKTYPYMTLSNNTNNLAVLAVCKNFIMMAHFLTPGITVGWGVFFVQRKEGVRLKIIPSSFDNYSTAIHLLKPRSPILSHGKERKKNFTFLYEKLFAFNLKMSR